MSYSFSIITPAYNSAGYINKAIDSIVNCNYDKSKLEYIIIDDGSTDNTFEVVKPYLEKYQWIKYITKTNGNWGSVINYAISNKLVHNDYVLICDSDDVILPNAFSEVNKKCHNADMVYGSFYLWNGKKIKIYCSPFLWFFRRNIIKNNKKVFSPINVPITTYVKKEIFYQAKPLIEKKPYQDTILYNNFFLNSKTARLIKKPIGWYWKWRDGNTMTQTKVNSPILIEVCENLIKTQSHDVVFHYILGCKTLRKYLKEKNISFQFKNKLSLKWFPLAIRWIAWILYFLIVRKYLFPLKSQH